MINHIKGYLEAEQAAFAAVIEHSLSRIGNVSFHGNTSASRSDKSLIILGKF